MSDNNPTEPLPPLGGGIPPVQARPAESRQARSPVVEPVETSPGSQQARSPEVETSPAKKRSRRPLILAITLLTLVILAIVAFFVGESMARDAAANYVRERVIQGFGLPENQQVDVSFGEGYLLLQALSGKVDEVNITIPEFSAGQLRGDVVMTARGVPLDSNEPVELLDIEFAIPAANLNELAGYLSGADLESIELDGDAIRIGSSLRFFSLVLPVAVGLEPSAVDGELVFTPVDIVLGEQRITVEDLRGGIFGGLADMLLQSQAYCVASSLPASFEFEDVQVRGNELVISIDGSGSTLGNGSLSTRGSCD